MTDAQEAPEQVHRIRAEYAAVDVDLVHDQQPQFREEVRPTRVLRQHRRVQHVRIGEHNRGVVPQLPPHRGRRVAVVDSGQHIVEAGCVERGAESLELILTERLGGKKQQGPRLGVIQQRFYDGNDIAKRFP